MSETATVQVAEVKEVKSGTGQKGPWTLYHLVDGNGDKFATFSKGVYEAALPFVGKRAELDYSENEKGKTFTEIREPAASNGDTPPLGTGEYVTGQKPAIEARRIYASTAANCATQLTNILIAHQTAREITPEYVLATWDAMCAHVFLDLTRKGDAIRDEDIPF